MNKSIIWCIVSGVSGIGIGSALGYIITKKTIEKKYFIESQESINNMREFYKEKYSNNQKDGEDDEEIKEKQKEELKVEEHIDEDGGKVFTVTDSSSSDPLAYSNVSKKNKSKKKKSVKNYISIITEEEWKNYEGNADVYKNVYYYEGDEMVVDDQDTLMVVFRDNHIKKFLAEINWEDYWDQEFEEYGKLYILTEPGIGSEDGCLMRVGFTAIAYMETDAPYAEDNIWSDTREDCNFSYEEAGDIRGDLGSGNYEPEDHKNGGCV